MGYKKEQSYKSEINECLKQKILELLLKGVYQPTIREKLKIDLDEYNRIKNELIKEGKISLAQINISIQEKRKRDKEKVYHYLLAGYSHREITSNIENTNLRSVQRMINELVNEGRITADQIKEYRHEEEREIKKYILRMLKEGYTHQEIADLDVNGYLTESNVRRYKNILVSEGLITEKQIERAKSIRKLFKDKERKIVKIEQYDESILRLFKLGFMQKQIVEILGLSNYYVKSRKDILYMRKQISDRKIEDAKNEKENNAKKRRRAIDEAMQEGGQLDLGVFNDHIEYCKAESKIGEVKNEDIRLLAETIVHNPELMTLENIGCIVTIYTRKNNPKLAIRFLNGCMCIMGESEEEKKQILDRAKKEIEHNMKKREAARLLNLGYMPLGNIADETGLRIKEVLELKGKTNNTVERQYQIEAR